MKLKIFPPEDMIMGTVEVPVSKSVANRRMIIDALAGDTLPAIDRQQCGTDISAMRDALEQPGATEINIGGAGTAMRFLTALYAATPGRRVRLDGDGRMRQRPMAPLVEALRQLGADIAYAGAEGHAPLLISGKKLAGGSVRLDASVSSQFVTALMLVAPAMEQGLEITLDGPVRSEPYIRMTLAMMGARGVEAGYDRDLRRISVSPGRYTPDDGRPLEGDWSAMAFWLELCAVSAGFITVEGLDRDSVQGDRAAMPLFAGIGAVEAEPDEDDNESTPGAEGAIELCGTPDLNPRLVHDFSGTPDLAQPALVACCLTGIPFKATGLDTLADKETNRLTAITEELGKLGYEIVSDQPGTLEWEGRRRPVGQMPGFDARGDHRMAMSLAPVAVFVPGITIDGAECVDKSYPGYWDQLRGLGFTVVESEAEA